MGHQSLQLGVTSPRGVGKREAETGELFFAGGACEAVQGEPMIPNTCIAGRVVMTWHLGSIVLVRV